MKKVFYQTINAGFRVLLIGTCMALILSVSKVSAQNCKPDYSKLDKIEKKQIDAWSCDLFETSMGGSLTSTSTVTITAYIGRTDTSNFVELHLTKREASDENQLFESSLKGAKGNEFYFGLKDGEPQKFIVTDAVNKTKRDALSSRYITTVVLSSTIKAENLQALKDALTTKPIDAVRIKLQNDNTIEQSIKEKNGNKMMQKAICFFNFLQGKG